MMKIQDSDPNHVVFTIKHILSLKKNNTYFYTKKRFLLIYIFISNKFGEIGLRDQRPGLGS